MPERPSVINKTDEEIKSLKKGGGKKSVPKRTSKTSRRDDCIMHSKMHSKNPVGCLNHLTTENENRPFYKHCELVHLRVHFHL